VIGQKYGTQAQPPAPRRHLFGRYFAVKGGRGVDVKIDPDQLTSTPNARR